MKEDLKLIGEFKDWLNKTTTDIAQSCGIGPTTLHFSRSKKDAKTTYGETVFSIKYVKPYKTAYIIFYPIALEFFRQKRINELMLGLTHEVCHILTEPMLRIAEQRYTARGDIYETNEELTEGIAMIARRIIKVEKPYLYDMPKGRKKVKKKIKSKIAKQQK